MTASTAPRNTALLIWDLPVRLFHWALVPLLATSWYTVEVSGNMRLHMLCGYTILALVLFRVVWGFVGTRYARWTSLALSPAEIGRYARRFLTRAPSGYLGHSPLGGLSVLAMLAAVLAQTLSGLFATDEDFYAGPLNDYVSGATGRAITVFHGINFNVLLALIVLHVVTVLGYLVLKRENLIGPMITGRKPAAIAGHGIDGSRIGRAALALGSAAAAVYAIVNWL